MEQSASLIAERYAEWQQFWDSSGRVVFRGWDEKLGFSLRL
jgi:hypothetical protein